MAKALVNFYYKGKYIEAGTEAPEGSPKRLIEKEVEKLKAKKSKTTTKNGKPKNLEDK